MTRPVAKWVNLRLSRDGEINFVSDVVVHSDVLVCTCTFWTITVYLAELRILFHVADRSYFAPIMTTPSISFQAPVRDPRPY